MVRSVMQTTLRAGLVGAVLATLAVGVGSAHAEGPPERPDTRQVMFVGNNWEGTATVIDARTFERLFTVDTVPDYEQRMEEIRSDPERLAYFLAIRQFIGEGNDQLTDDMFTNHEGTEVYVSRPSFADVVGIDLATNDLVWRYPMDGQRADHMAISPDGTRLLVSDSTANIVHEIDPATGEGTGTFPSGDSPHENVYIDDGNTVLHASIGRVYTPTDRSELGAARSTSKGERWFQVVDADTLDIIHRWNIGEKLNEAGYEDMSAAVRPMAHNANHPQLVYFQVSFHHGFVEYDLEQAKVLRVAELPVSEEAQNTPREEYLLDSAHHGLAMNPEGTKLCAAGTMSDYAALVDRETFEHTIVSEGTKPYWSTNGTDGKYCWVSYSGDDSVAVIDYASEQEIARIPVGDHPQRVRVGAVKHAIVAARQDESYPPSPSSGEESPAVAEPPATPATGATATVVVTGLGLVGLAGVIRRRR